MADGSIYGAGSGRSGDAYLVLLSGVLLGLADVVGWLVVLWLVLGGLERPADVSFSELPPDLAAAGDLAPELGRAMRANVLIEQTRGLGLLGGRASGSGVILELSGGEALIVDLEGY